MSPKPDRERPAETVDDYLAALPAGQRAALEQLRAAIRAAAPEAEETISYRIPTYRYHGSLVHFAAFPNHSSLIVVSRPTLERFLGELEGYHVSGTTIRFTADHPLPPALVDAIVRARVEENEARGRGSRDELPPETNLGSFSRRLYYPLGTTFRPAASPGCRKLAVLWCGFLRTGCLWMVPIRAARSLPPPKISRKDLHPSPVLPFPPGRSRSCCLHWRRPPGPDRREPGSRPGTALPADCDARFVAEARCHWYPSWQRR